jgi:hypothetical protein
MDCPGEPPLPSPQKLDPDVIAVDHTPFDPIERPKHYTQGAVECIDAIEAALGREQFIGFLRGQVIKYQWRLGRKAGGGDAGKARWYAARLEKLLK